MLGQLWYTPRVSLQSGRVDFSQERRKKQLVVEDITSGHETDMFSLFCPFDVDQFSSHFAGFTREWKSVRPLSHRLSPGDQVRRLDDHLW